MQYISTPNAPRPAGHYSQAVVHGGFAFVAGQLAINPESGEVVGPGDIEVQAEQTLRNVGAILAAAGSSLEQMVSVTIYLTDMTLWPRVNEAYARVLGAHRPARAVVPVPALRHGCLIEVQAIGAVGQSFP